ncbi:MAG: serine hydrolase, partial [Asticcacaulis sp.]
MITTRRGHVQGLMALLAFGTAGTARAADNPFYGTWTGILDAGAARLTLRLVIDAKGVVLISVDQGGARIPASGASIEGERIRLAFSAIKATYEGALSSDRHIDGTFTQGGPLPLRFTRGEVAELTPEPVIPPLTRDYLNDQ